uniref:Uncharacterized protein n=1 Tax=Rhizophora mucronata TaxID=61149 RepID=A0A2P2P3Y0_RHIMU
MSKHVTQLFKNLKYISHQIQNSFSYFSFSV